MKPDHALKYVVDRIFRSVLLSLATLDFEQIRDKFNTYITDEMHSYTRRHRGLGGIASLILYIGGRCR